MASHVVLNVEQQIRQPLLFMQMKSSAMFITSAIVRVVTATLLNPMFAHWQKYIQRARLLA